MKKNNLFSEKALKFSEEELTEKAKKYAWFEAPNNLHYLTVPLVKKGYHAGYKQCKEDLWEWLDRMSTKYPDDPIHVLRELHLKLEEK